MKVAVVGLGWWGKQIIRTLDKSPLFEVLYGVDPAPPADALELRNAIPFRIEGDLATVLADPAVEGVILATPHAMHEAQALAVLEADKNLFCEKPLTMTGAGAKRILDACGKHGKVLGIGHERRWEPAYEELARMLAAGALGKILLIETNISHNLFRNLTAANWRLSAANAPAGMMTAVGIHLTDLMIQFVGPPAEVRARTASQIFEPPAEDFVTASIVFKSGVRATFTSLSTTPYYGRFTIYGDAGWVEIVTLANVDQGKPTIFTHADGKERRQVEFTDVDTVRLNFESWANAVAGRETYRFTREQLIDNIRLFEAIVTSSRNHGAAQVL
jgi:predicted dehydrogenase